VSGARPWKKSDGEGARMNEQQRRTLVKSVCRGGGGGGGGGEGTLRYSTVVGKAGTSHASGQFDHPPRAQTSA